MILGERVKKLRKSLDLTQKQFASRVPGKVDDTYIGKIERGTQYPSLKLLEKIGKTYAVPLSYFFDNSRESKQGVISYVQLLNWLDDIAKQWEEEAQQYLKQEDYLGYGASKSLAIQTKAMMHRIVKKAIEEGA